MKKTILALFILSALMVMVSVVSAATDCTFTTSGTTITLDADCTTDETIEVPDGFTLDGDGYTITAEDPAGNHFRGAVIMNAGTEAHVTNLKITTDGLANACDGGADRLRGIMFEGASGSITHTEVMNINQGASGCQEGNAIEVRNAPFDGTHPDTQSVEIAHNKLTDWQKTGIVCNGDVYCSIHHNFVGESATQDNLAANSIQIGFGATGEIVQNRIEGNQWKGTTNWAATAILIYLSDSTEIVKNIIKGNSDIGLYLFGDNSVVDNNKVFDEGADHPNSGYDIGIGDWGSDNEITNNKVRGFDTPYDGVEGGKNKVVGEPNGPNSGNEFW